MDARLEELDLTLTQLAADSRIAIETIRAWRSGKNRPHGRKARRVEEQLQWTPGSILVTLDGGDPTPLEAAPGSPDPAEARVRAMEHLPPEMQQAIIDQMRANRAIILEQAEEMNRRLGGETPPDARKGRGRESA